MRDYYGRLSMRRYESKRNGKGWKGTMDYYEGGKRKQKSKVSYCALKRDAREELEKWRNEQEKIARNLPDAGSGRAGKGQTISEVVTSFIESQLRKGEIERSTFTHQMQTVEYYVNPLIGDLIFSELDRVSIENWYETMAKKGLSQNTITGAYSVVNKVYKYFVKAQILPFNPLDTVARPTKGKPKVTYMDRPQFQYFLDCREKYLEEGDLLWAVTGIAVFGGLRREEICGLRWYDVDFKGNIISITSAVGVAWDKERKQTYYTKGPKNATSTRRFPMTPQLAEVLSKRYKYVEQQYGVVNENWFVCGEAINYTPPTTLSKRIAAFSKAHDIREHFGKYVTLHCLRHNLATMGIQSSMDIASLTEMMGHASKAMTLDTYASSTPDAMELASKKLGKTFNNFAESEEE